MAEIVGNLSKMELVSTSQATTLRSLENLRELQRYLDNRPQPSSMQQGTRTVTDHHGEVDMLAAPKNIISARTVSPADGHARDGIGCSDFESDPLIDPIWVAMLTLYINDNKTMPSNKLINKFADEIPTSSIDRYFRFMHEMNLVETKSTSDLKNSPQIKLTSKAVRLVENGLRSHG